MRQLSILALGITGMWLIADYAGWQVALGAFLLVLANNIMLDVSK